MKIISKILAFALAAIMLFGGVSVPASAASDALPVDIYSLQAAILIHKSDGTLWRLGEVWDDNGGQSYRSLKIADNVKKLIGTLVIKNDDSLWDYEDVFSRSFKGSVDPVKIADNVKSASRTYYETTYLVVKNDNTLWGMGDNNLLDAPGITEDKNIYSTRVPKLTKIMDGVSDVHCTGEYTAILKTDGTLWIRNFDTVVRAQRGNLTGGRYSYRGSWHLLDDVVAITHDEPLLALKKDGSLWDAYRTYEVVGSKESYYGEDLYNPNDYAYIGKCPGGLEIERRLPYKLLDNVSDFTSNYDSSFAIKSDGTLWAWGDNTKGTLGNGDYWGKSGEHTGSTNLSVAEPVKSILTDVYKIAFAGQAVLAVKNDGSIWAWGLESDLKFRGYNYDKHGAFSIEKSTIDNNNPDYTLYYGTDNAISEPVKLADNVNALIGMFTPFAGSTVETPPTTAPALVATPTASTVYVNGQAVAFDAYTINGNNYFKLRDLVYILNGSAKQFDVGWDGANNAISLTSGKVYTAVGGEMTGKGAGEKTPTATSSKIYLDGKEVSFTAYTIDGNNYFKLRDIGLTFDFGVTWDGANNAIVIDTSMDYTPD